MFWWGACLKLRNFSDFSETSCKHNAQLCLPEILKAESRPDSRVTSDYGDPEGQGLALRLALEVVGGVCAREELGESSS